jgi:hypothetical protein
MRRKAVISRQNTGNNVKVGENIATIDHDPKRLICENQISLLVELRERRSLSKRRGYRLRISLV